MLQAAVTRMGFERDLVCRKLLAAPRLSSCSMRQKRRAIVLFRASKSSTGVSVLRTRWLREYSPAHLKRRFALNIAALQEPRPHFFHITRRCWCLGFGWPSREVYQQRGTQMVACAARQLCEQPPSRRLQLDTMKTFIDDGGSVLVMLSEGGEAALNTNINYLTEQ